MKIIDNRAENNKMLLSNLEEGDTFELNNCIYIKGHQLVGINAFNCHTNSFVYIEENIVIRKVSAKIILSKIIKGED